MARRWRKVSSAMDGEALAWGSFWRDFQEIGVGDYRGREGRLRVGLARWSASITLSAKSSLADGSCWRIHFQKQAKLDTPQSY